MKRPLKIIFYSIAGLIALIALVVIVAVLVVDPNVYKGQIEKIASKQIDRKVRIGGDIDLSLFPWIGVRIRDVSVANVEGFPKDKFATVDNLGIKVKLIPLFAKDIQVGGVKLSGFTINLTTDENGRKNWEGMSEAKKEGKKAPEVSEGPGEKKSFSLPVFEIQKVDISKGTVNWTDKTTGTQLQFKKLRLSAGPVQMNQPFSFQFDFSLENNKPELKMDVEGNGKLRADLQNKRFSIPSFQLSTKFMGPVVPGDNGQLTLNTEAEADLKAGTATIHTFSLDTYGLNLTGSAKGKDIFSAPLLQGQMELARFNPRKLLKRLGNTPPSTKDGDVLAKGETQLHFRCSPKSVEISDLSASLDETSFTSGRITVKNLSDPAVDMELEVDKLNVDRYMPKKDKAEGKKTDKKSASKGKKDSVLPVKTLRKLDLDGRIYFDHLTVKNVNMQNVELIVSAHKGLIDIEPLKANLYEGTLHTTAKFDVRKLPRIQTKTKLDRINIDPLLKDVSGMHPLTGKTDFEADIGTKGRIIEDWLKNLDGNVSMSVDGGAIRGINFVQKLRSKIRTFKGMEPKSSQKEMTDFTELRASAEIEQGVARKSYLTLQSPLLNLEGSGRVDLVQQVLDYSLKAELTEEFKDQAGIGVDKVGTITVPVSLSGSLTDPDYNLDVKKLFQDLGQQKIKEQIRKHILNNGRGKEKSESKDRPNPKEIIEGIFN